MRRLWRESNLPPTDWATKADTFDKFMLSSACIWYCRYSQVYKYRRGNCTQIIFNNYNSWHLSSITVFFLTLILFSFAYWSFCILLLGIFIQMIDFTPRTIIAVYNKDEIKKLCWTTFMVKRPAKFLCIQIAYKLL